MGNKLEKQYENAQKTGAISLTDKKLKKVRNPSHGRYVCNVDGAQAICR